ncbi:MAG: SPOR domain-containing protein [Lachnospiraceae bacterium]|nr:SPOR domain-containing protein [Lachnospiraceae bacterium]
MKYRILPAAMLLALAITACGSEKEEVREVENTAPRERETVSSEPVSEPEPEPAPTEPGFAERAEGKYSYHLGNEDGENEYLIMNVVSFAGNLYAYCGEAYGDGNGELEAYSFWATEFMPEDDMSLKSPDAESVNVTALSFSVMSNAGKYWGPGAKGSITLDRGGLVFEDFGRDGFLVPDNDSSRLFLKDERVEDVFPYLKHDDKSGDDGLSGYWKNDDGDTPVYLYFTGSDAYIYMKPDNAEVSLSAGGMDITDGHFECTASTLGCGDQPWTWEADYETDGDKLKLKLEGDPLPGQLSGDITFERCEEKDVHLTTMGEMVFDDDSFGMYASGSDQFADEYANGFYGVWIAAEKDREKAVDKAKELYDLDFESYVAYSPEWKDLNDDPYYCVTSGRYYDEQAAKDVLEEVKNAGYTDAYVKYTGTHDYMMICYTNYGNMEVEINDDSVVIKDMAFYPELEWSSSNYYGAPEYSADLVIDKDTVFADGCETEFFGNYEDGESPYDWFVKNYKLMESDADQYMSNGPALSGVFEVSLSGGHIERFYGCYWWD